LRHTPLGLRFSSVESRDSRARLSMRMQRTRRWRQESGFKNTKKRALFCSSHLKWQPELPVLSGIWILTDRGRRPGTSRHCWVPGSECPGDSDVGVGAHHWQLQRLGEPASWHRPKPVIGLISLPPCLFPTSTRRMCSTPMCHHRGGGWRGSRVLSHPTQGQGRPS